MTVYLVLGGVGIALLLISLLVGDHVNGVLDALGGGDWFSGSSLAAFLGALGFGGAIVLDLTGSYTLATIAGVAFGLVLAAGVAWGFMQMRKTQDGGAPQSSGLVDKVGTVISDIPADGYGEIHVLQSGHILKLNARSAVPLPTGTQVTVVDVLSATAVRVMPTMR